MLDVLNFFFAILISVVKQKCVHFVYRFLFDYKGWETVVEWKYKNVFYWFSDEDVIISFLFN